MKLLNINSLKLNIENIEYAKYNLKPIYALNAKENGAQDKEGALLKFAFRDVGFGYSDCFSWETLGDIPLSKQIENLARGIYNSHLEKSLFFAYIDAQYRALKCNIFQDIILPKNHYTCVNLFSLNEKYIENLNQLGFSFIKLKCGMSLAEEYIQIKKITPQLKNNNIKLRLDFNSTLNLNQINHFLENIKDCLDVIHFIEDPIPFNINQWVEIKNKFPYLNMALDRFYGDFNKNNNIVDFIIIKPALQKINDIFNLKGKNLPVLFTSYMDHPFGQLTALYEAALFYKNNIANINQSHCGFLTHNLYEKNIYSETFEIHDTKLIPSFEGTGFGFDGLLKNEVWRRLL
ncbi:hypothetical protein [Silvanigrella aquatica]|uniref:OSBS enolase-like N-terminal domain-containing protein n=1 Tax=Silvanigrella aquatica TaxID=1915309 RepID=A0A1L4D430_9BACT|nr:hypothetical protein [Silvanigrella aquatica]APJ04927.1 hypothetical protein AXG55_13895 [Silvanigrella aquatica]